MRKKWPISRAINFRALVLRIINGVQKFIAIRYLISQWKTAENSGNVYIAVYERRLNPKSCLTNYVSRASCL